MSELAKARAESSELITRTTELQRRLDSARTLARNKQKEADRRRSIATGEDLRYEQGKYDAFTGIIVALDGYADRVE
jgi:hypothetical protein